MAEKKPGFTLVLVLAIVVTTGTFFLQVYKLHTHSDSAVYFFMPLILNLIAAIMLGFVFAWFYYFSKNAERARKLIPLTAVESRNNVQSGPEQKSTADLERISQLLAFTNYSDDLLKQLKMAFNLAHEVFSETAFLVFLNDRNGLTFLSGSAKTGEHKGDIPADSTIVKDALNLINSTINISKLDEMKWKSFGLPLKSRTKDENVMIMPLLLWNRILGLIVYLRDSRKFSSEDEKSLCNIFNRHLANFVENHNLFREKIQQERLLKEVEIARTIQMDSLPKVYEPPKNLSIMGVCLPCYETSGDYYDFIRLSDGRFYIVIADVSSKGLPAAIFLSKIQTLVRAMAEKFYDPASFLSFLSSHFCREGMSVLYATMFIVLVDPRTDKLVCSNAGHCKPIIIKADRSETQYIEFNSGIPLGLFECEADEYKNLEIKLEKGDSVLLYSDGLSELAGPSRKRMSADLLKTMLLESDNSSPEKFIGWLRDQIDLFREGVPFEDDLTLVYMLAEN
ncbi:MAG: SpoIIE family protein phosphatase [Candidatus Riflebacteria bacterium]|nr:SpoIIE family protein phosphatase [Candidatus Riflebacteria bacterium]